MRRRGRGKHDDAASDSTGSVGSNESMTIDKKARKYGARGMKLGRTKVTTRVDNVRDTKDLTYGDVDDTWEWTNEAAQYCEPDNEEDEDSDEDGDSEETEEDEEDGDGGGGGPPAHAGSLRSSLPSADSSCDILPIDGPCDGSTTLSDRTTTQVSSQRVAHTPAAVASQRYRVLKTTDRTEKRDAGQVKKYVVVNSLYTTLGNMFPVIRPYGTFHRHWELVVYVLCGYYWWSVLFFVFFPPSDEMGAVLVLDVSALLVHVVDVFIELNTALVLDTQGRPVIDKRVIAKNYATNGRFVIDVLSILPLDFMLWRITRNRQHWAISRCNYLIYTLKLRNSLVTKDSNLTPALVQFYFFAVPVLKTVAKILAVAHVCIVLRMTFHTSETDEARGHSCGIPYSTFYDVCFEGLLERYFGAALYGWSVLTSQGGTNITLKGYVFCALLMCLCPLLQGHVMAKMSQIVMAMNIEERNLAYMRECMATMNHFRVPDHLQTEVLSFSYHSLSQFSAAALQQSLNTLPAPIVREVLLYIKVRVIQGVPMFHGLDPACTIALGNCLISRSAEPGEKLIEFGAIGEEVYFLMYGHADILVPMGGGAWMSVAILSRGELFGEVALLKPRCPRTATVQALQFCDLFVLTTVDFLAVQDNFGQLQDRMATEARHRGILVDPAPAAEQALVTQSTTELSAATSASQQPHEDQPATNVAPPIACEAQPSAVSLDEPDIRRSLAGLGVERMMDNDKGAADFTWQASQNSMLAMPVPLEVRRDTFRQTKFAGDERKVKPSGMSVDTRHKVRLSLVSANSYEQPYDRAVPAPPMEEGFGGCGASSFVDSMPPLVLRIDPATAQTEWHETEVFAPSFPFRH
ncbi:Potassium channel KAT3 [Diplonema papillatum]|nr:Potassium channel KAT3 [Diplonema papillatum]